MAQSVSPSADPAVGIDVVDRRRRVATDAEDRSALERAAFSPAERAWVAGDPTGDRHLGCLAVKEGLVKALGGWPARSVDWASLGIDPSTPVGPWCTATLDALAEGLASMVGATRVERVSCSLDDTAEGAALVAYGDSVVAAAAVVRSRRPARPRP